VRYGTRTHSFLVQRCSPSEERRGRRTRSPRLGPNE
jgi:hypothetical protein